MSFQKAQDLCSDIFVFTSLSPNNQEIPSEHPLKKFILFSWEMMIECRQIPKRFFVCSSVVEGCSTVHGVYQTRFF